MTKTNFVALLALLFAFAAGLHAQDEWTRYSQNPYLMNNGTASIEGFSPYVYHDPVDGKYKMWYSKHDADGIMYIASADGLNWDGPPIQVLSPLASETHIRDAKVFRIDTTFVMYYSSEGTYNGGNRAFAICRATSSDGISWTRSEGNPVLLPSAGKWDASDILFAGVVLTPTGYRMWYSGYEGSVYTSTPSSIGEASSIDGVHWTKYASNPVLSPLAGSWEPEKIQAASVVIANGSYVMFYVGGPKNSIGYATSPDGYSWTRAEGNPIFPAIDGTWETYLGGFNVYLDGDMFRMWYAGITGAPGSVWKIGYASAPLRADLFKPGVIRVVLHCSTSSGGSADLILGTAPGATDTLDALLDETELPPLPPESNFDARWLIPSSNGALLNLKDTLQSDEDENIYKGSVQLAGDAPSVLMRWSISRLPEGTFILQDAETHGGEYRINMKTTGSFIFADSTAPRFEVIYTKMPTFISSVVSQWNMVSIPAILRHPSAADVFPHAISKPYRYSQGYASVDSVAPGPGYWVKFAKADTIGLYGIPVMAETIAVHKGWNLIGALSGELATTKIVRLPDSMSLSSYFAYQGGYFSVDVLKPAKAYWVKCDVDGTLILRQ